jgi:hypothetical protein
MPPLQLPVDRKIHKKVVKIAPVGPCGRFWGL